LVLDTGENWDLEPFQANFISDVFSGVPECWLVVPEGNAKTTLAAALALYHCQFTLSASVPVGAASREQAEILYRQAEGFVFRSPAIHNLFVCLEGYRRIRCDSMGSRIQIFAADDKTGDGVIPTLAICEELHRQRDLRLYRTWRGKLEKRGGQLVAISTAGEPGGEFEETREKIRLSATVTDRSETFVRAASDNLILHEWAMPAKGDIEDLGLVKRCNPLKALTVAKLKRKWESPTMTREHWSRYVCNLPTRSENAAIQEIEWANAATTEKIPKGTPIWVGLDIGWKWDTTAILPHWWRDEDFRLFGPAIVLVPPRDSTSLDPDKVERALVVIHERNPIHTVVMDMSRGEDTANWIKTELGAVVVDRTQGNEFACQDYEKFMEALRNGQLKHSGDADLKSHALNAIARMTPSGKARFDRPSQTRQGGDQERRVIDALTAAAMVHATVAMLPAPAFAGVAFR
jgi:phage terminase large subunit-like protein